MKARNVTDMSDQLAGEIDLPSCWKIGDRSHLPTGGRRQERPSTGVERPLTLEGDLRALLSARAPRFCDEADKRLTKLTMIVGDHRLEHWYQKWKGGRQFRND